MLRVLAFAVSPHSGEMRVKWARRAPASHFISTSAWHTSDYRHNTGEDETRPGDGEK